MEASAWICVDLISRGGEGAWIELQIRVVFQMPYLSALIKPYAVDTHSNRLNGVILITNHIIDFCGNKIIRARM